MSVLQRITFRSRRRERVIVLTWLQRELEEYADAKFNENDTWTAQQADDVHTRDGVGGDSWWLRQIEQYLGRADVQGLDTLGGRQALFKACTTMLGLLESTVRVYGPPPRPGVPSGTVDPWPQYTTKEEG